MGNQRYYWFKVKEDFFDGDTISWLKEKPDGLAAIAIYFELCTRTIKNEGKLSRQIRNNIVPHTIKSLSNLLRINEKIIETSIKLLEEAGLIATRNKAMFLPELPTMIGSETQAAGKMRALRARREKDGTKDNKAVTDDNNVIKCYGNVALDIERDTETDRENRDRNSSNCGHVENPRYLYG